MKSKQTLEETLQDYITIAFPEGDAPAGLLAMLTGQASVNDAAFAKIQRLERDFSDEDRALFARRGDLQRFASNEQAAFSPSRDWLNRNHASLEGEGPRIMGQHLVREMAHARIMADIDAAQRDVTARDEYVSGRLNGLRPINELLHIRAGIRPHSAGLAAKLGVTLDELMTPAERQKLEAARRAEDERAAHKAAEDERNAALYEQQEREREAARLREQAEAEEVDGLSPVQWLNLIYGEATPTPAVVRCLDGRGQGDDRAAALTTLWDRQGWPNYSLAQRRASRLLHDHLAGLPRSARV